MGVRDGGVDSTKQGILGDVSSGLAAYYGRDFRCPGIPEMTREKGIGYLSCLLCTLH